MDEFAKIEISQVPCMIELEERCWDCGGGKFDPIIVGEDGKCERCKGSGILLTEEGQTILDFVKKHLKLKSE